MTPEEEAENGRHAWEEFLPARAARLSLRALGFLIDNLGILLWWMALLGAGLLAVKLVIDGRHLGDAPRLPFVSSAAMVCALVAYTSAVARRASGVSGVGIPFGTAEIATSAGVLAIQALRQEMLPFALGHAGQPLPTILIVGANWIVGALAIWLGVRLLLLFPAAANWGRIDIPRVWTLSAQKFWLLFFAFAIAIFAEQVLARVLFMPIVLLMQATTVNAPWEAHRDPSQLALVAVLERVSWLATGAGLGAVAGLAFKDSSVAPASLSPEPPS